MSKLKPCPFCGCCVPPAMQGNGIGDNWLECTECRASTRLREDGAGSEKDWNRRAVRCNDTAPVAPIGDDSVIAQYQHRYVGDPRQLGIWENSRNIDWAKRIWEECEDHIDPINKWEVRALVLAAVAAQGESGHG